MPHQGRRSGHSHNDTPITESRRTVTLSDVKHKRPVLSRRQTPVSGLKHGRSHRERERDRHDSWDDEGESFPQFCMTCEKQFMSHDEKFLYCSENCRRIDQSSTPSQPISSVRSYSTEQYTPHTYNPSGYSEPRDIIPRASPSRPSSMLFNTSPPASPGTSKPYPSAMSALRSLNTRPPSPPSPTESNGSIWPFGRSIATSPSNSYSRPSSSIFSSTYDSGYGGTAYTYESGYGGVDSRPLPSRHPVGASSRPKSIELVTPMLGR